MSIVALLRKGQKGPIGVKAIESSDEVGIGGEHDRGVLDMKASPTCLPSRRVYSRKIIDES
jgi:hypothetical protein